MSVTNLRLIDRSSLTQGATTSLLYALDLDTTLQVQVHCCGIDDVGRVQGMYEYHAYAIYQTLMLIIYVCFNYG